MIYDKGFLITACPNRPSTNIPTQKKNNNNQRVKSFLPSPPYIKENRCDFLYKRAFHLERERKRKGRVNIAIILHLRESKSYFACHYSR